MKVGDKVRIKQESWDRTRQLVREFYNEGPVSPVCTVHSETDAGNWCLSIPGHNFVIFVEDVLEPVEEV